MSVKKPFAWLHDTQVHSKKRFVILTKFVKTTHCQNNTFLLYTQDIVITATLLLLVTSSCLYK